MLVVCCSHIIKIVNIPSYTVSEINLLNLLSGSISSQYTNIKVSVDRSDTTFGIGLPNFNSSGEKCIFKLSNSVWSLITIVETIEPNGVAHGVCINFNTYFSSNYNTTFKSLLVGSNTGIYIYKNINDNYTLDQHLLSDFHIYSIYSNFNGSYFICSLDVDTNGGFTVFKSGPDGSFYNLDILSNSQILNITSQVYINEDGRTVAVLDSTYESNTGAIGIFGAFYPNGVGSLPIWNLVQILSFATNSSMVYGADLSMSQYNLLAVTKASGNLFVYNNQELIGIETGSGTGTGTNFGTGTGIGSQIVYTTYRNNPINLNSLPGSNGVFIATSYENGIFVVGSNNEVFVYRIVYSSSFKILSLTLTLTIPLTIGNIKSLHLSYSGNLLIVCGVNQMVVIELYNADMYYVKSTINLLTLFTSSTDQQFINIQVYIDNTLNAFAIGLPNFDSYGRTCVFRLVNNIWTLVNTIYETNNIYGTITNQGISISLNLSYNTLVVGSSTRTFIYKFVNNQFVLNQDLNQGVTSLYLTYNANYLIVSYTFSYFRSFIVYELQHYGTYLGYGQNQSSILTSTSKIKINEDGTVVSILNPTYNSNAGAIGIFIRINTTQGSTLGWGLVQTLAFPTNNIGTNYGSDFALSHYTMLAVRASGHIYAYNLQNTVSGAGTSIYSYDTISPVTVTMPTGTNGVFISSSFAGDVFVVGYDSTVLFYSMIYRFITSRNVVTLLSTIPIDEGNITSMQLSSSGNLLIVCCLNMVSIFKLIYSVSDPYTTPLQTSGSYTQITKINMIQKLIPQPISSQFTDVKIFIDNSETSFALGLPNFNSIGTTCILELINSNWVVKNQISSVNDLSNGKSISLNLENKFLVIGKSNGVNIYKYGSNGFVLNQQLLSGINVHNVYLTLNANFLICNTDYLNIGGFYVFELQADDTFRFYNGIIDLISYEPELVLTSAIQINDSGSVVSALDPTYKSNVGAIGIFIPPDVGSDTGWQLVQILEFNDISFASIGSDSTLNYYNLLAISRKSNSLIIFNSKNINGIGTASGMGGTGTNTSTQNTQFISESLTNSKTGFSVSINYGATFAAIGMTGFRNNSGGVILMKNPVPSNQNFNPADTHWSFEAFLHDSSQLALGSQQGYSISPLSITSIVSGAVIAIGAPYYNGVGGAYIYVRNNSGVWTQQGPVLTIDIPNSMFGCSVSIDMSGNNLAVGAYGVDNNSGATYIYVRLNNVWTLTQKISDILQDGIMQGFSISMGFYNNVLLVGAPGYTKKNNGTEGVANTGAVFLYYNNNGVWIKKYVIKDSLPIANGSQQGYSVSLSSFGAYKVGAGESIMIAIGAPNYNNGRGAIYAYQLLSSDVDNWNRLYPIITDSSDFALGANLGSSVSLVLGNEGFIMASGANNYNTNQGALYFYKGIYNDITNISTASLYLKAYADNPVFGTTGNSHFGNSVAVNNLGNYMLVGAPELNNIGSVKAYYNDSEKWYEDTRFKTVFDGILGLTGMSGLNPYNSQILTGNGSPTSFEPNGQIFVNVDLSSMTETGDTLFVNVQSKKTRTTIPLELYYISDD